MSAYWGLYPDRYGLNLIRYSNSGEKCGVLSKLDTSARGGQIDWTEKDFSL